jgi:hypothetical protein
LEGSSITPARQSPQALALVASRGTPTTSRDDTKTPKTNSNGWIPRVSNLWGPLPPGYWMTLGGEPMSIPSYDTPMHLSSHTLDMRVLNTGRLERDPLAGIYELSYGNGLWMRFKARMPIILRVFPLFPPVVLGSFPLGLPKWRSWSPHRGKENSVETSYKETGMECR